MIQKIFAKLSDREKKIVIVASIIGAAFLFDLMLLSPSLKRLEMTGQKITTEKAAIKKDLMFLTYEDKVMSDHNALKQYLVEETKSQEQIITAFLTKVEKLASQSGVELPKITPAGQELTDDYLKFFLTLDCSGEYDKVVKFIHDIDSSSDLLRVTKVDLKPRRSDPKFFQATLAVSKMLVPADPTQNAKTLVKDLQEMPERL